MSALPHALRTLARGWRSGRLLILLTALALAVAALGSVGLFTARVAAALERQSGDALGGDLLLTSRDPLPAARREALTAAGLSTAETVQFQSVALAGDNTSLVSVKAVGSGYPRRGQLTLAEAPFAAARPANGIPEPGTVWVDARVLNELGLAVGASFQLGDRPFRLAAVIVLEPDRGGGFSNLAPRLMMNLADLPATHLLGPGSRATYGLQLAGSAEAIAAVKDAPAIVGERRVTPQQSRPELKAALERAGRFLDIASLAAALLAAAAVAITARGHGAALADEIALLKTLGARQGFLARTLLWQLLLLGLAAGVVGAALAWSGQFVLAALLAKAMEVELPMTSALPLLSAVALGLVMLLGFAAPPVLAARRTPPTRVLARASAAAVPDRLAPMLAVVAVALLLLGQTGSPKLALYVFLGTLAAAGVLALLGTLAVRALAPLRAAGGTSWRFGLGNIARRQLATVGQVVALGLALLALLLISVVRQDLLSTWQQRLPADAPNRFLINIQPAQREGVERLLQEQHVAQVRFAPMLRARLSVLKGEPVNAESFTEDETQRWVNREFNLTWTDAFGPDNTLQEGQWWTKADAGKPWLSIDTTAAERLKLKVGDTLTLDFTGTPQALTVKSIRKVSWDSFRPNFFLATPPGVLEAMPGVQWIVSFYLPRGDRTLLPVLVKQFPNVTAFDLDATLEQVRSLVDRVVRAVEFVFLFALAAGLLVLLAAIDGTRGIRSRETALLRTLGARTATLRGGLIAEYALLGLISGTVAAVAAQCIAWLLATQLFSIPYGPRPLIWLTGAAAGTLLVTALGYASMRRVLRVSPRTVLG